MIEETKTLFEMKGFIEIQLKKIVGIDPKTPRNIYRNLCEKVCFLFKIVFEKDAQNKSTANRLNYSSNFSLYSTQIKN